MLVAVVLWLVLGFDGRLHWDEPQYLYSGAYFSIEEILAGEFQPSRIAGFTVSRITHVIFVKWLAELLGIGAQLVAVVMVTYVALLLIFFVIVYVILRELAVPATESAVATVTVMFSPVGLYLAYKTLPDVPALMWSSLAVLAAICLARDGRGWVWFPIGALSLAMTALTKHVLVWTFVSFAAAAMVAGPVGLPRAKLFWILMVLPVGSVLVFSAVLIALGLDLFDFLAFLSTARQAAEPLAAKGLHILIALGMFLPVLSIAAFHHDKPMTRFFWVWFAIATLPFLVVVPRLEIRYLASGLVPLAGLVFLALDLLRRRLPAVRRQPRLILPSLLIFIAVVGLSSRSLQGLTAHEVEVDSMHALFRLLDDTLGPGAYAVVTPWEYSTFLYLRLVYPDRPVYDAYDPERVGQSDWLPAQEKFFAGRVLRNMDQLREIDKRLVYVGFAEAMPIANLRRLASAMPGAIGQPLLQKLDSLDTLKHLSLSWMWDEPGLSLTLMYRVGNYLVYYVTLPETAAHAAQCCQRPSGDTRTEASDPMPGISHEPAGQGEARPRR